jgi:hypothetical protein
MILHEEKIQDDVVSQIVCEGIFDIFKKKKDTTPSKTPAEEYEDITGEKYPETIEKFLSEYKHMCETTPEWEDYGNILEIAYPDLFEGHNGFEVDENGRVNFPELSWYKTDVVIYYYDEMGSVWWSSKDKQIKVLSYIHPRDIYMKIPLQDVYDYDKFKVAIMKLCKEHKKEADEWKD